MNSQESKKSRIYLDYAATTPVDSEVLKAMIPYFSDKFGNASSVHSYGQEAIVALDKARQIIADFFACDWREIIFTGSATESNNLAIRGLIKETSVHIITTTIEHESVHESLRQLEKSGHEVTRVKCDKEGLVSVSSIEKAIKDNTILISVIYANNEIGVIQPVKEIGKLLEKINKRRRENGLNKIYFHTDAVQALNYLEARPDWLKVDMFTFSGHKIYGPKGISGLYVRKNTPLNPLILGGGQEFGLRSGTENVASSVGLAKALELVTKHRKKDSVRITKLRDKLLDAIIKTNINIKLNGSLKYRLPNNLNLRFAGYDNETLLVAFDQVGLAVSAGSACSARAAKASYVLSSLGLSDKEAKESIRITLGRYTTDAEINSAINIIKQSLKQLS